jgi:cytochrome c2
MKDWILVGWKTGDHSALIMRLKKDLSTGTQTPPMVYWLQICLYLAKGGKFMFRKILVCLLITSTPALLIITAVSAGGWAVITLDDLPGQVVVGESFTIGFMVRQHGRIPMSGLTPSISARNSDTGDFIVIEAVPEGETGHYSATLTLPKAGQWQWSISAFSMAQAMPALHATPTPGSSPADPLQAVSPMLVGGIAGVVALAGALMVLRQRQNRWAVALLAAALIFAGSGWVLAADIQSSPSQSPASASSKGYRSQVDYGQALFIAKGCLTCHTHQDTDQNASMQVGIGPDLSNFQADAAFLRRWLADPGAIKPDTAMPNLELGEAEIEALIAFINAE